MRLRSTFSCLILLFFLNGVCYADEKGPCQGNNVSVVVDTGPHKLWLCEGNKVVKEFKIALGRGGIDKRKRGDNKTPLGGYPLGTPQPSNKFAIFIPIGYPTGKQRAKGFTGSDIGIHGPSRIFKWLGRITTWFDWTQGCIAVGTDDDISEIARWMKEKQVSKIIIK
ncbi:MAG: L,D-transpeptidase family protein [Deltaproteobacteria bacterium]|nr:L,D-transpeptidase family protein [Deltaproteobacteria bacterium]